MSKCRDVNCPDEWCRCRPLPAERPGGWVEGIGWVAKLSEVPERAKVEWSMWPGRGERVCWAHKTYTDRPVVVTEWSDGSIPEPPKRLPDVTEAVRLLSDRDLGDALSHEAWDDWHDTREAWLAAVVSRGEREA